MGDRVTVRVGPEYTDAIEEMENQGFAENDSEAHRELLDAGMSVYGFQDSAEYDGVLKEKHRNAIDDMVKKDLAEDGYDALSELLTAGMHAYGYRNGDYTETALKRLSAEFSKAFAWVGVGWLALTLLFPVQFRIGSVFAFSAALACSGMYVLLDRHEPKFTNRLRRLLGGGESA